MTTKREDAESIVDDEEVLKGLDLKSQADDALVIKTEDNDEDEMMDGKKKKKGDKMEEECSTAETPVEAKSENTVFTHPDTNGIAVPVAAPVFASTTIEQSPVEKSLAALAERVNALKSQGLSGPDALQAIQSDFENLGNVIKAEFTPPPSPEEVAQKTMETTLRSLLNEVLPTLLAPIVARQDTLEGELRAKSLTTPTEEKTVQTVQRSLPASVVQRPAVQQAVQNSTKDFFQMLAERSVGGIQ